MVVNVLPEPDGERDTSHRLRPRLDDAETGMNPRNPNTIDKTAHDAARVIVGFEKLSSISASFAYTS